MKKIFYFIPNMSSPSGGMGVLMKQAKILHDNNYDVSFLYYNTNGIEFNPTWMDFSIDGIKKISIKNILTDIDFKSEDLLIIPEGFGELIKETKDLVCKRVVLAQSWIYILNSMQEPFNWSTYGIRDVISISDGITEYIYDIMDYLEVYQYKQSINHNIFKPSDNKEILICFSANRGSENRDKTISTINIFKRLSKYSNRINFVELKGYSREEFAKILGKSSICLYTDEIAGFGTLPLEAMACNTHVVGFWNMGNEEYINDDNGFWVDNGDYIQLGKELARVVDMLFENKLSSKLLFNEKQTSLKYNQKNETIEVLKIFKKLLNE